MGQLAPGQHHSGFMNFQRGRASEATVLFYRYWHRGGSALVETVKAVSSREGKGSISRPPILVMATSATVLTQGPAKDNISVAPLTSKTRMSKPLILALLKSV